MKISMWTFIGSIFESMLETREATCTAGNVGGYWGFRSALVPAFLATLFLFIMMCSKQEKSYVSSMQQSNGLHGTFRLLCTEKYHDADFEINKITPINGSVSKDITLCKEANALNIATKYPMYLYVSIVADGGNILSDCLPSTKVFESNFEGHSDVPQRYYNCTLGHLPSGKYNITVLRIRGHPSDVRTLNITHFMRGTELAGFASYTYDELCTFQVSKGQKSDMNGGYWKLTNCSQIIQILGYHYCVSGRNEFFFFDQSFPTAKPTNSCLNATKVMIVGDSRMEHIHEQLRKMYPHGSFSLLSTNTLSPFSNETHSSMFIGLQTIFGLGIHVHIYQHLIQGKPVIFNSILHDLVDFVESCSTFKIRFTLGLEHCGDCVGNASYCKCQEKLDAVQNYITNIERLGDIIAMAKRVNNLGRFIWISHGIKPPLVGHNHTNFGGKVFKHDLLHYLESLAATIVIKSGGEHLDLRHMLRSAPRSWWYDIVHYARPLDAPLGVISSHRIANFICGI